MLNKQRYNRLLFTFTNLVITPLATPIKCGQLYIAIKIIHACNTHYIKCDNFIIGILH